MRLGRTQTGMSSYRSPYISFHAFTDLKMNSDRSDFILFADPTRVTFVPASSPIARDQWGIFELNIKKRGDEGSDGKLYARSHHPSLALLACSRVPNPHLALGKPVEEAAFVPV